MGGTTATPFSNQYPVGFSQFTPPLMYLQTPMTIQHFLYAGIDTRAKAGDELLGLSLGRLYLGIYPTATGFEVAYGILNSQGCL